jgi:CheY-like chemotaxis protein
MDTGDYSGSPKNLRFGCLRRIQILQRLASEVLSHVFEPFFTTKEVGKGSGLGLSMVYGFAKQFGGTATIYSEPGDGTTVKLYLPRSDNLSDKTGENGAAVDEPVDQGETILIVEDDPDVRTLAVALLSGLGYGIAEAGSAEAALKVMQHASNPIDLLLSNVVLPGVMNGPDLAAEVRRRSPGTKIVYMTGYAEEAFNNRFELNKDSGLLQKPFKKVELARMVRSVLDNGGSRA